MNKPADLYERDFVLWAEQQARALRELGQGPGSNLPLDWENLAEEIESLAGRDRRELRSRLRVILVHLLKLQISSAREPRLGWKETIGTQRLDIQDLLQTSPSLRREIPRFLTEEKLKAWKLAAEQMEMRGESVPKFEDAFSAMDLAEEQVLGDWWPENKG